MSKRDAAARILRQALRGATNDAPLTATTSARQSTPALRNLRLPRATVRQFSSKADPSTRGPVSYVSLGLTMATGAGLLYWYQQEKEKKLEAVSGKNKAVAGQATIGGPFQLIDTKGKTFTEKDLLGAFTVLYFGFTHCPDICPDELEKLAAAVDIAAEKTGAAAGIVPVFITVDPERDGTKQVADYVKEFHPRMIGLTGSPDAVREAAKQYRVYYTKASLGEITGSKEPGPNDDYLVDHSIITYLLDPEGNFVTFYGKNYTDQEMGASLAKHVEAWKKSHSGWPKA